MAGDVLVAGETLIDFVPDREASLAAVERFERRPGGAPANVAVGLARLGRPPLFWTRVGDDPFGRSLEGVLADHDVSGRFVEVDPRAKTTLAFVACDERGDRTFTFYRDDTADTRLRPGAVPDDVLADVDWVHAGGVALSSGRAREATLDLLERAASRGCTVSFDPNYRPELWPDTSTYRRVALEALAHVDVPVLSAEELGPLGGTDDGGESHVAGTDRNPAGGAEQDLTSGAERDLASDLLDADRWAEADGDGPHTCVVTRGPDGAVAVGSDRSPWPGTTAHAGYDADAVDATGAGDAFVAGLVDSLLDGATMDRALAVANAVGALTTTATGGIPAIPSAEELRSFLNDRASDRG